MSAPYLRYRSEDEYHEHYTLLGLLERETNRAERRSLKTRICEIEQSRGETA